MAYNSDDCETNLLSKLHPKGIATPTKIPGFTCCICYKTFRYDEEKTFRFHLHSHIDTPMSYIKSEENKEKKCIPSTPQILSCIVCNKMFSPNDMLPFRLHLWSHTESYPNVLNSYVPSSENENLFTKKNPLDNLSFKCSVCNKTFSHLDELAQHLRIHIESCPYECAICKSLFDCQEGLETHMHLHVQKIPVPYSSGNSTRNGISKGNFKKPLNVEAGNITKPSVLDELQCRICGRLFDCQDDLSTHLHHHQYGTEGPNSSSKCSRYGNSDRYSKIGLKAEHVPKPKPSDNSEQNGNSKGHLEISSPICTNVPKKSGGKVKSSRPNVGNTTAHDGVDKSYYNPLGYPGFASLTHPYAYGSVFNQPHPHPLAYSQFCNEDKMMKQ